MIEDSGFRILDDVTETSRASRMAKFPLDLETQLARAAAEGRIDEARAVRWLDVQRTRDRNGRFAASWRKVLVIATKP